MIWIIIAIIIILLAAGALAAGFLRRKRKEPSCKAAGKAGENAAAVVIRRILRKSDQCFRNITVTFDGQETELDFLIINSNGVFIIEVKNYSGRIRGREDQQFWKKTKTSQVGNIYVNTIENPIHQVKREEYILGNYLRSKRIRVWVNGYIYFVRSNRPFRGRCLLNSGNEIDQVIHEGTDDRLSSQGIDQILQALSL